MSAIHALAQLLPEHVAKRLRSFPRLAVEWGAPPRWFGYRHVVRETVPEHMARRGVTAGQYETVHPESVAANPLPRNVSRRSDLPNDPGWWGYSYHDVPGRVSGETFVARVQDALVTWYQDPDRGGDFYPAILANDGRALDLREIRFRAKHAEALRQAGPPVRLDRATWFAERVYDNHSHWLTAHLPKLLLLRERGELGTVLLPPLRTESIDRSLRMLGLDPEAFPSFQMDRPLFVAELTVVGTDRFRPELLRKVRAAYSGDLPTPKRRIYVSRARASRRRLLNEEEVWPLFEGKGFERVFMEDLPFEQQVTLMQETAVLAAPHGAGLTNMLFCSEGARVVEIADLSFPNPNFYALASGLGLPYWIVRAESVGEQHPLERDMVVSKEAIQDVLLTVLHGLPSPSKGE